MRSRLRTYFAHFAILLREVAPQRRGQVIREEIPVDRSEDRPLIANLERRKAYRASSTVDLTGVGGKGKKSGSQK